MEILATDAKYIISHGIFGVHFNITITENKRIVPLEARIVHFWNYLHVIYSCSHHDSSTLQKLKYHVIFCSATVTCSEQNETMFKSLCLWVSMAQLHFLMWDTYPLLQFSVVNINNLFLPFGNIMKRKYVWNTYYFFSNTAHQPELLIQLFLPCWGENAHMELQRIKDSNVKVMCCCKLGQLLKSMQNQSKWSPVWQLWKLSLLVQPKQML